jgi:hypothetical protein
VHKAPAFQDHYGYSAAIEAAQERSCVDTGCLHRAQGAARWPGTVPVMARQVELGPPQAKGLDSALAA